MDVSIHHDPFAPDDLFDLPEPSEQPYNHAEDADSVDALKKLLGRKLLSAHSKRMADVPS